MSNQENDEGMQLGCVAVNAVDKIEDGCDAVVNCNSAIDNCDAVVDNCDPVVDNCDAVVDNFDAVVDNCNAVVASCDDMGASCDDMGASCAAVVDSNAMVGCVDIQTDSEAGRVSDFYNSSGEQNTAECNVRLVEVSEENIVENNCQYEARVGTITTMQAKNIDKGTFTNI